MLVNMLKFFFIVLTCFLFVPNQALSSPDAGTKIVGGSEAAAGAWPSVAALVKRGKDYNSFFCGGTLIDSRWVLTAGHCVDKSEPDELDVIIGRQNLEGSGGERIAVAEILIHPDFGKTNIFDSDVALMRLASPSSQTPSGIIDQGDSGNLAAVGNEATIVGWGKTGTYETWSKKLLQAKVDILSVAEAEQDYAALGLNVTENMIPIGVRQGWVGICSGDSGGPLFVSDQSGGMKVAGVTSWSNLCCAAPNLPGFYARLSKFTDWVNNATGNATTPEMTVAYPVNGATGVFRDTALFVQFNTDMDPDSINTSTFTVTDASNQAVSGKVRYHTGNRMALFYPTYSFSSLNTYTAKISSQAQSLTGRSMAADASFSFTTGTGYDRTYPSVVGSTPANGASNVSRDASGSLVFSEYMDPFTVNSSTAYFTNYLEDVGVTFYNQLSKTATVRLDGSLGSLKNYTLRATYQIRDMSGNMLQSHSAYFSTAGSPQDLPALVDSVIPCNGTDNRTVATVVTANFNAKMDASTLTTDTFTLENAKGKVSGTVTYNETFGIATFTPTNNLDCSTIYTATLGTGVKSLAGASLNSPVVWSFTTSGKDGGEASGDTDTEVAATKGTGNIKVKVDTGGARLFGVNAISDTDTGINTSGKPSDYSFPAGLVAYQVSVPVTNPGSSATITLTFPGMTNGTRVYKVDSSGFSQFAGGAISNGDTVTLTVTDGGTGDADGIVNGVINDPVGLAVAAGSSPSPSPSPSPTPSSSGGGGGGGGGCLIQPEKGFVPEILLLFACAAAALATRGRRPGSQGER